MSQFPPPPPPIKTRTGIVGIERGIQEKQRATDASISQAFQDLSKLMTKAKEMVSLSKAISMKIKEKQGEITEDETIQFKSYLLSLGIDDPVTRDACKSESQFHKSLARQIAEVMTGAVEGAGGMMTLPDVYCRVNRARGFELLSPEDFLESCKLLGSLQLPLVLRRFDSGVLVLQLQAFNDTALLESTADYIRERGGVTSSELAQHLGVSVMLAHERLLEAEAGGFVVRDDSISGLVFYFNLFLHGTDDMIAPYLLS